MDWSPKRTRTRKEQMQLDRNVTLNALSSAIARDDTGTLTSTSFRVVWRLLTHLGEEGEAFPSMATLAASLGMNERTVRDHLQRATNAGFIKMRRDGRRKTNVYSLSPKVLVDQAERVSGTGDCETVKGPTAPVTLSKKTSFTEDVDVPRWDRMSPQDGFSGSATPSDRASGAGVTGAAGPTIHLEPNHLDDPRNRTLVRLPFGQSDEVASEQFIRRLTLELFKHTHGLGRERSRKSRIAQALRALNREGVDLHEAARGTIAIMNGPDAHNEELGGHASVEKILRERRWESWLDDDDEDAAAFA